MWIARDKDGKLLIYLEKPSKINNIWTIFGSEVTNKYYRLPDNWFPEIKWEDKEPKELILK